MRTIEEIKALYQIFSVPFHKDAKSLRPPQEAMAAGVLDVLLWLLDPPERAGQFAVVLNAEELALCYVREGWTQEDIERLSEEVYRLTLSLPLNIGVLQGRNE